MVTITDAAAQLLTHIQTGLDASAMLRVVVEDGEFVLGASAGADNDEIYFHDGEPLLRLTAEAAQALDGFTFSTEDTPEGPTLAILTPEESEEDQEA
jgi:hypothetical protein